MSDSNRDFFEMLARVLLRCWLLGFALVLTIFGPYMLAGDLIGRLHGGMFGISKRELDVIFYCFIGSTKILVLTLFLIPWAAIRLALAKK